MCMVSKPDAPEMPTIQTIAPPPVQTPEEKAGEVELVKTSKNKKKKRGIDSLKIDLATNVPGAAQGSGLNIPT